MTYAQAKMRIWAPETYTRKQVAEAVAFILGTLAALREDLDQAAALCVGGSDV